jgi:Tol biopolymer transport system component
LKVLSLSVIALLAAGAGTLVWRATVAMPKQAQAAPATSGQGQVAVAKREQPGKIFITAQRAQRAGPGRSREIIYRLMAVDPMTGATTAILDGCSMRPRVSPDGKLLAFERDDALWVLGLDPNAEPTGEIVAQIQKRGQVFALERKIVGLGGSSLGSPPVWSPDGKQIVISLAHAQAARRVNIDGTGSKELPVPPEDLVLDWSSDGRWLLTASPRGAKNGSWQLYIMRPDGTQQRRITEEGNPFYARFSPDGRRVLYTDNGRREKSGIWVVDADGKNARLVFPVANPPHVTVASACWSPDGKRIAIILAGLQGTGPPPWPAQIVVMDQGGGHRSEIEIPQAGMTDMPDWR